MRFTLDISGDQQVQREMLRFIERGRDMRPVFKAIISDLLLWETELFESEGATAGIGGGWVQLSDNYARWKEANYPGEKILHLTGALERALTGPGNPQGSLRRTTATSMIYGTTLPYAGVHQNPKETNPLPKRRPIAITMEERGAMIRMMQLWITRGIVK